MTTAQQEHLPLLPEAAAAFERLQTIDAVRVDEDVAGWSVQALALYEQMVASDPSAQLTLKAKYGRPRAGAWWEDGTHNGSAAELATQLEADLSVVCQHCSRTPAWRRTEPINVACEGCAPLWAAFVNELEAPVS